MGMVGFTRWRLSGKPKSSKGIIIDGTSNEHRRAFKLVRVVTIFYENSKEHSPTEPNQNERWPRVAANLTTRFHPRGEHDFYFTKSSNLSL